MMRNPYSFKNFIFIECLLSTCCCFKCLTYINLVLTSTMLQVIDLILILQWKKKRKADTKRSKLPYCGQGQEADRRGQHSNPSRICAPHSHYSKGSPQTSTISITGQLVKNRLSDPLQIYWIWILTRSLDVSNAFQNWRSTALNHYSIVPYSSLNLGILSYSKCLFSSLYLWASLSKVTCKVLQAT